MWALVALYTLNRDDALLSAAVRAADAAVADQSRLLELDENGATGQAPARSVCCDVESALGAMAILAQITGQDDYLDYCRRIVASLPKAMATPSDIVLHEIPPLELVSFAGIRYGHHTHSFLSIAHGIVDLAVATGEQAYLDIAERILRYSLPSVLCNCRDRRKSRLPRSFCSK